MYNNDKKTICLGTKINTDGIQIANIKQATKHLVKLGKLALILQQIAGKLINS
jgi:hypothetical protein